MTDDRRLPGTTRETMKTINIDAIVFDADTQTRADADEQVISDYTERMAEGDTFPPVVLFHDGSQF